ncbi:MAG TPA: polysaccharide biosynthesis/export family protein [Steroidobacteraceae bacterium]|nr:polysaccharide biosynthesis/export family protein [Steroidobacteraceae bacterium]
MQHPFRVVRLPLLAACLLGAWATNPAAAQTTTDYHIHPGDKILIGLYDDPKMQPVEITVAPDGKLAFPLIGVISAGGKTVDQLRVEMETKLKKFVSEPVVTVAVTQVLGNVAYVIGQVNKPGSFIMNPTINVLQALALAGGGNPYAKLDGVIVIRSAPGGQRVLNFHYSQVASGRNLEQNVQLEAGDVVVVP